MAIVSRPFEARARPWAHAALAGLPWLLLLAAATAGFVAVRGHLDKVYTALGYLLIVLFASARSGRAWGFGIAMLAFLCFNFFLLPPYYELTLHDPFDWVVLGSFLVTSGVAAHLLDVARREAREARARAEEVDRFSVMGAEALNAGRAEQGVDALARLVCVTLGANRCDVHLFDPAAGRLRLVASTSVAEGEGVNGTVAGAAEPLVLPENGDGTDLLHYAARYRAFAVQRPQGDVHVEPVEGRLGRLLRELPGSEILLIPLVVRDRTVGVLRVFGGGRSLNEAEVRFVEALAYYLALGVERVRLVGEEERAMALREAGRLKDALLAAVSHDLRTPLTTIKAVAQELRAREKGAAVIEAEADRLNRFVADLLDVSRLDSGSLTPKPEIVPADDLVGAALQQVAGATAGRDIRVQVVGDQVPAGRMDFVLALRCLANLLDNACKYAPSGPIEITVGREGDAVAFTVADRGPGIPEEDRPRIFEPFNRGRPVPDGGGTGLGLSIARRLAHAQGGDVRYAPRAGGGSEFVLTLPAAEMPSPAGLLP